MAWIHRLSEVDPGSRSAVCAACGPVRITRHGSRWCCATARAKGRHHYPDGTRRPVVRRSPSSKVAGQRRRYRRAVGEVCEMCGFVPEDACQLDVHHRDGDHSNQDAANLQTLCANCHRLTTKRERA